MKGLDWTLPANAKEDTFTYNGKEKQTDFDLNISDFEARGYDYQINRTWQIDPHAESYYSSSPYSFLGNNPLFFIDPTGMDITETSTGTSYTGMDAQNAFAELQKQYGGGEDDDGGKGKKDTKNKSKEPNKLEQTLSIWLYLIKNAIDFYSDYLGSGMLREDASTTEKMDDMVQIYAGGKLLPILAKIKTPKIGNNSLKTTLSSWKKINLDMKHILSGHTKTGSRVSSIKTLFPENMSAEQVEKTIRSAYKNVSDKIQTQGERLLLRGTSDNGIKVEMWLNKETKMIETAYPIN